jgi:uncharacterized protein
MIEKRNAPLEIRARGRKLEGYAALFGTEARMGKVRETIAPKAFSISLASGRDVLALADHDPAKVLARTRSGTLRLSEDTRGLAFDLDVPDTTLGRDLLALAERGDLGGMSFGFRAIDEHRDGDTRQLRVVDLIEISVVQAFPAYDGTTVEARNLNQNKHARRLAAARYLQLLGAN